MDLPVAANIAILTLGASVGLFETVVYLRRPTQREALWVALIALAAAVYSACQVYLYQGEPGPEARLANQLLYAAVVFVVHGVLELAASITERPLRRHRWWLYPVAGAWVLVTLLSPWVVNDTFVEVPLGWLSQPFPQHQATLLTSIFLINQLVVAAVGAAWLFIHPSRRQNLYFGLAFGFWVGAGVLDSAVVTRLLDSLPTFLSEYGLVAMVLALGIRAVSEYTDLLDQQQQSFRELIELSPLVMAVHRDGDLLFINRTGAAYLGYESQDLVGSSILDLVHPGDRESAIERIQDVEKARRPNSPRRQRLVARDGELKLAEVTTIPVSFDGAEAALSVARDVGERERLEARMMEMDRMVAVGTLAAGVAHEINNPLTFVLGNLDLLSSVCASAKARTALADACMGARRIQRIVQDLSGMVREDEPRLGRVDVAEVGRTSVRLTTTELRHRATVVQEFEPVEPVLADPGKLGQVFTNLLINAAQAMPLGHASEHTITVRTRMVGARVCLEVEDTGTGIEPELLQEIFQPFVTTKAAGEGTGLGLAISRQIVEGLGGEILVHSEVGEGSCFQVLLPRAPTEAPTSTLAAPRTQGPTRPSRILLVDDEALVLRVLERVLSRRHRVDAVSSVAEALALLEQGKRYDLLLCDLMMPDQTGMDLYEQVQERFPEQLPDVHFMSGGVFSEEGQGFVRRHGIEVLAKPLEVAKVEELLRGRPEGDQDRT